MKIFNKLIKKGNKRTKKRNPKFMKKLYRRHIKNHKKIAKEHSNHYKKLEQYIIENDGEKPREFIEVVCEKCGNCILLEEDMLS